MVTAVFIIVALLAAGGIGYMIHSAQASYERKINDLERQVADQVKRLEDLERGGVQKSRNPYLTNVGLEDAMAIVMESRANLDRQRLDLEYQDNRLQHAIKVMGQVRSDPSNYDEDAPNGKRWIHHD